MMILDRSQILIRDRQRTTIEKGPLEELRSSILERGLLQPPVFRLLDDGKWELVAGERRLRAIDLIAKENETFFCNGELIVPGKIPALAFISTTDKAAFEAELEENIIRVDLSWQDRQKALAMLHRLRSQENPDQTFKDTANEVSVKTSGTPLNEQTKTTGIHQISRAVVTAQHLHKPEIAKARNEHEAYRLILKQESAAYEAELLRRRVIGGQRSTCSIRHGDMTKLLPQMNEGVFDLILTDPPYGVGADKFRTRTEEHHNYADTPESAKELLRTILIEGFRVTKLKANLFIFTDIRHFEWLQSYSSQMGWMPWRTPILWQKSEAEGLAPWGREGFARTYDLIFWATKGQRGIRGPCVDILNFPRVKRNERIYGAEKPLPLLSKLIEISTLPDDMILDPCAGSGSTIVAAKQLKRHGVGIEIAEDVANLATVRLEKGETFFQQNQELLEEETDVNT